METKETESAGGVVVNNEGNVLVVNQNGDSWSLPKGHIDPGESKQEAAIREIKEETGVANLELLEELGSYERYRIGLDGNDDLKEKKIIYMYLFKTDDMNLDPEDPSNPEARWVSKENVADLLTHIKDAEFFVSIMDRLTTV